MTPLEETVCSHAFIAYRSGIRSYRLREEARTAEAGTGTGSNDAATGARTGARACTCAEARACEAGKEVMSSGIVQFTTLSWPPSGGLFFGKEWHAGAWRWPEKLSRAACFVIPVEAGIQDKILDSRLRRNDDKGSELIFQRTDNRYAAKETL